ncbi:unnamed protein product [Larinioides sclopetarius]|uniref:Uncharacterized protein n=1 Tax=Larinioides sclopetarius TaxID=280406 RepID=A0AAV1ZKM8_9ARAC
MIFRSSFSITLTLALVDTTKMPSNSEREKENYQYFRTTCGLIGFIVFFLGSFLAFILAEETGQYCQYTILFGFVMLTATALFFCCVLHESKKIHSSEFNGPQTEQESLLQPQPEQEMLLQSQPQPEQEMLLQSQPQPEQEMLLQSQPQPEQEMLLQSQPQPELPLQPQSEPESSGMLKKEPHWSDKFRIDKAYIRQILGLSPSNSNETTSSENNSDPDMVELRKITKSESSAGIEEPMPGTSKESQDKDTARYEAAADFQFESTKEGPSKVAGKSSEVTESKYDDIPLKDMSALSLSDSSKCTIDTEEKQDVSTVLSQLSLENSEKQVDSMQAQGLSSTDSDGKSEENPSGHAETNIIAEDGESKKEA